MNAQLQVENKPSVHPAIAKLPSQTRLAQRRCACGGTAGPDGECAACRAKRLSGQHALSGVITPMVVPSLNQDHQPAYSIAPSLPASRGHHFAGIQVRPPEPAHQPAGRRSDTAELPVDEQQADPSVDLAQDGPEGAVPPSPTTDVAEAPRSCCRWASFEKSDDSYVDTPTDTRKNIKFTYTVNYVEADSDARKCVMVNWIQGTAKNKDGSFRKVKMFDKTVDYNFPTMRIDSLDKDPVYWSNSTARWNYQAEGTGFYATDSPGPQTWVDGIDYDLKFKMCLYCIDDVSTTSDETGSGVKNPLKCIDWVFKAKYDAASGTFTH